jgi:LPXTG-site transpeptidase (sortase) family protein
VTVTTGIRPGTVSDDGITAEQDTAEIPVVRAEPGPLSAPTGGSQPRSSARTGLFVVATALTILGAFLLGLVAQLTVVGTLQHSRDQEVLFDEYRYVLADSRAPVGQVNEGALLAPGSPVALIRIPAIGVDEVVVEGTTSGELMSGPGHRRDTVLPGQAGTSVVMGRQAAFGGPFGRLDELAPGDVVEFTTGQGEQSFTVTGLRRSGDTVQAPEPGQARVTLVTAGGRDFAPDSTLRVDAVATTEAQPAPARVVGSASLSDAEQLLAGDPSAWVPLAFWAQALVAASIVLVVAALRWGRWHAWVIGVPVIAFLGLSVAQQVARLLPNLL